VVLKNIGDGYVCKDNNEISGSLRAGNSSSSWSRRNLLHKVSWCLCLWLSHHRI